MSGAPGRLVSLGRLTRMDVRLDRAVSLGESPDNDICLVGGGIASRHARIIPAEGRWQVEVVDNRTTAASFVNGRPITQPTVLSHLDVVTLGQDVELVFLSPPAAQPASQRPSAAPAPPPPAPKAAPPAPAPAPKAAAPPPPPSPSPAAAPSTADKTEYRPPSIEPPVPPPQAAKASGASAPPPMPAPKSADATVYQAAKERPVPPPIAGKTPAASPAASPAPPKPPAPRVARLAGPAGSYTLKAGKNTVGRAPDCDICLVNRQISRDHAVITVTPDDISIEHHGAPGRSMVNGEAVTTPRVLKAGDRLVFVDIEFEFQLE